MPSLRSINKEAGTNFRRWEEVTEVLKIEAPKPTPIPEVPEAKPVTTRLEDHPDIAKALAEGWTIKDVENGRNAAQRMHMSITAAQQRHGKDSLEVLSAIEEANRVSVMLTSARAAYNRILRDDQLPEEPVDETGPANLGPASLHLGSPSTLTPGEDLRDNGPPEPPAWRPMWSKEPYAKYRELQNIPEHWEMWKVVLIWFGESRPTLRVFSLQRNGYQTIALMELTGSGDLKEVNNREGRWDFALTREQYDVAASTSRGQ